MNLETYAAFGFTAPLGEDFTAAFLPYLLGRPASKEVVAFATRDGDPVLLDTCPLADMEDPERLQVRLNAWAAPEPTALAIVTASADRHRMMCVAGTYFDHPTLQDIDYCNVNLATRGSGQFVHLDEYPWPEPADTPEDEADAWWEPEPLNPALARLCALDIHARLQAPHRHPELAERELSVDTPAAIIAAGTTALAELTRIAQPHADARKTAAAPGQSESVAASIEQCEQFLTDARALANQIDRIWCSDDPRQADLGDWAAAAAYADGTVRAVAALLTAFGAWRWGLRSAPAVLAFAHWADPTSSYVQALQRLLESGVSAAALRSLQWTEVSGGQSDWSYPTLDATLHHAVHQVLSEALHRIEQFTKPHFGIHALCARNEHLELVDLSDLTGDHPTAELAIRSACDRIGKNPQLVRALELHGLVHFHAAYAGYRSVSACFPDGSTYSRWQLQPDAPCRWEVKPASAVRSSTPTREHLRHLLDAITAAKSFNHEAQDPR